jgi:CheY-like chemotaxis protein
VRQLLLFSRKAESTKRSIELQHEVEHAKKMLERTIPKMVAIQVIMGNRLWAVNADPVQIEQMLLNLGTNAADAMPDGGKLLFELENVILDDNDTMWHPGAQPGRYVLLTITDTGHGMDKETLGKIFDPFFTTKEFGKGTGLGLASVYGIVKSHGGYITCYSEVGRGTTFKIYFPAMDEFERDNSKSTEVESMPKGTETILLVDDEESIRDVAQQALVNFGYKVLTASSGEQALEILADNPGKIDLVVMDLGMPGMGGHRCLQELLRMDPAMKVIIASGYSADNHVKRSLEHGAVDYLSKPYLLVDLLKAVRAVLDGGH